jgi:MFS family permease
MTTPAHAFCDAASLRCVEASSRAPHPRLVLVASVLASSLPFVDGSVVNVALPAIGQALSSSADALQWTVNIYLLPLSAMLLLGGAAGDRFGRRRLLVWGTVVFAAASLACSLAPHLALLLAARFLQGIGGAMLIPNSLAILGQTFREEEKGRAVGIWAAASAIAGALGPVVGGWLVDLGSWRAIFLINLPIAAIAVVLALRYVPEESAVTLLLYGALGALLVLVPYVLIEALQYSGTQAGAALLPLPIMMVVVSPIAGAHAERIGPRLPIAIGSIVVGLGMLLTLRIRPFTSYWAGLLPAIVTVALGLSVAVAPLTSAVLSEVAARLTGVASGLNNAVARIGGLLATALVGFVFASHGAGLLRSFHITMLIGAVVCWGAAIGALALVPSVYSRR